MPRLDGNTTGGGPAQARATQSNAVRSPAPDAPHAQNIPHIPHAQNAPHAQDIPHIPHAQNVPHAQNAPDAQDGPDGRQGPAPRIGVLALQGDYAAHAEALREAGAEPVLVRRPEELASLEGLVLPGGESTTFLKFLERGGFLEALRAFTSRTPTFGTCAGCILLASEVSHPPQASLGVLDATVERNAYGRQLDSSIEHAPVRLGVPDAARDGRGEPGGDETGGQETRGQETRGQETRGQETRAQETRGDETPAPLEMVYIRAPRITRVGPGVAVLAERDGFPVLVRQGGLLAATFHPELSADRRVHRYFVDMVRARRTER